jgi:uncharacterized membrane protein YebE (DUF533 family)
MLNDLTVLQAKVLALVGWVDGRFDESERIVFRDVLEASPGDDDLKIELFRMTESPPEKEDVFEVVAAAPREIAAASIKNAFVLAKADGHLDDAEMALLFELGQAAGVEEDRLNDFRRMLEIHMDSLELERDLFGT